jgi:hypothetical protein
MQPFSESDPRLFVGLTCLCSPCVVKPDMCTMSNEVDSKSHSKQNSRNNFDHHRAEVNMIQVHVYVSHTSHTMSWKSFCILRIVLFRSLKLYTHWVIPSDSAHNFSIKHRCRPRTRYLSQIYSRNREMCTLVLWVARPIRAWIHAPFLRSVVQTPFLRGTWDDRESLVGYETHRVVLMPAGGVRP